MKPFLSASHEQQAIFGESGSKDTGMYVLEHEHGALVALSAVDFFSIKMDFVQQVRDFENHLQITRQSYPSLQQDVRK